MVAEKYAVRLSAEDRAQLEVINQARILLKSNAGLSAPQLAAALDTSQRAVFRTKRRYAEEGLDGVLHDHLSLIKDFDPLSPKKLLLIYDSVRC